MSRVDRHDSTLARHFGALDVTPSHIRKVQEASDPRQANSGRFLAKKIFDGFSESPGAVPALGLSETILFELSF
jgi:hypothetical protein